MDFPHRESGNSMRRIAMSGSVLWGIWAKTTAELQYVYGGTASNSLTIGRKIVKIGKIYDTPLFFIDAIVTTLYFFIDAIVANMAIQLRLLTTLISSKYVLILNNYKMIFILITHRGATQAGQNGRHFVDGIFRCIFVNEEFWLKFHWSLFPMVQLIIKQHWLRKMAWRRISDKPLSEPMLIQFTDSHMLH